ncbi:methyltransferase domain-containing protein [Paenibacillus marinisediminis]
MVPKINAKDLLNLINKEMNVVDGRKVEELNNSDYRSYQNLISDQQDCIYAKQEYAIKEFLDYHDEQFIMNAYRGILHRSPDPEGYQYYLKKLRNGKLTKIDILGRLRFSKEAKREKVKIKGLMAPFIFHTAYKIPVLGYVINLGSSLLRLPKIVKSLQGFQSHLYVQHMQQIDKKNEIVSIVEKDIFNLNTIIQNHSDKLGSVEKDFNDKLSSVEREYNNKLSATKVNIEEYIQAELDMQINGYIDKQIREIIEHQDSISNNMMGVMNHINEITNDLNYLKEVTQSPNSELHEKMMELKVNLLNQERRLLILIEEVRKNVLRNQNASNTLKTLDNVSDGFIDSLYVSFEDKFRGTREDIKNRQKRYLSLIDEVKGEAGQSPILDIGCGRGEWLELLTENGYKAQGVDMNSVMVNKCREIGLQVHQSDALEYLRSLKDNSLRAVTGFHIIEHIPLKVLIQLFDEVLRVLKPGGVMLFETPNPESIWVGAYTFRSDPTHINPIVPDTVQFIAEQRGFINTNIIRLHKRKEPVYTGQEYVDEIIYKFNMEQDFSIVGYKA